MFDSKNKNISYESWWLPFLGMLDRILHLTLNYFGPSQMLQETGSMSVVLNLGSIKPQGFAESVSGVSAEVKNSKTIFNNTKFMFCWFCSLNTVILCATEAWFILCTNKIHTYVSKKSYFIFPITKGSVNALMKLAGFSTSNKLKNHWWSLQGSVPPIRLRTTGEACRVQYLQ